MSADLEIHIKTDAVTDDVLASFFSHTMGSKHFSMNNAGHDKYGEGGSYNIVAESPRVWVGEVSWLKAALFEDSEAYVPDPIGAIYNIIGEDLPVITDALIAQIRKALSLPNETGYSLASADDVLKFLEVHKGERAFTVSW